MHAAIAEFERLLSEDEDFWDENLAKARKNHREVQEKISELLARGNRELRAILGG